MITVLPIILDFLESIGLNYFMEPLTDETFLPGLKLKKGALVIDTDKLLYPGDILHEAGHLACMPVHIRREMDGDLEDNDLNRGGEMMAIAWSYAASIFLRLDPKIVLHEKGYKGEGEHLIERFRNGQILGLPLLQWREMSHTETTARKINVLPFPHMTNWTCQTSY